MRNLALLFRRISPSTWLRLTISFALLIIMLAQVVGKINLPFLQRIERNAYDVHIKASMPGSVDDRIVIADIDEKSLQEIGHWPWRRDKLAELVDTLFKHYKINVLGFDSAFPESTTSDAVAVWEKLAQGPLAENPDFLAAREELLPKVQYDEAFAKSIRNRKVVLGYVFNQNAKSKINRLTHEFAELPDDMRHQLPLPQPLGYTANISILHDNALGAGFFDNPELDEDGIFRRIALVQEHDGKLYPSLALSVTSMAMGGIAMDVDLRESGDGFLSIAGVKLGDYSIPVDAHGAIFVPYRGYEHSYPYFSISDILKKDVPLEKLKGKIVLMGTTSPGLQDMRSTPVQSPYPGVEVHANVVAGIMDGRIMHLPDYMPGLEGILLFVIWIIATLVFPRLAAGVGTLAAAILVVLVISLRSYMWSIGIVMPVTALVLMIVALFVLNVVFGYLQEAHTKRMLARQFGQYVPPELVAEMAEKPGQITLEGQARELTVLFSDVRGFTSLSEKVPPKELGQLMNELLTPLTQVIHKQRGTIDKYMGDAIMAFWGAPLDDPKHARNALFAAMQMQEEVARVNIDFAKKKWPEISIGIGLNTGVMSVGNMGSQFRMAYTVLGDAVNLGSRLEGLTKLYGVAIIVSESTKAAVPEVAFRELDRVRVKGKDQPVTIYEPLGLNDRVDPEIKQRVLKFANALTQYRTQHWDIAESRLLELQKTEPDHGLYKLYLERIAYYRKNPPTPDWDGVFTHLTK